MKTETGIVEDLSTVLWLIGGGGAAVPEHRTPDFFATKHEINPSLLSWHT